MSVFYIILIILAVIIAILLIGIVLIQKSKGGGLSSQFGGASQMLGVHQTNSFLENGTWWLAGLLALVAVLSSYAMPKMGAADDTDVRSAQEAPAPAAAGNQFDTPVALPEAVPAPAAEAPADAQ